MKKIGFYGCGNMASAFISGITSKAGVSFYDVYIHTRTKQKALPFLSKGAVWCERPQDLADSCDIIFICVKPQQGDAVLDELAGTLKYETVIVSILAGKKISYFTSRLGELAHVVRTMPNTPMLLGCGAVAVSFDDVVADAEKDAVLRLIAPLGTVKIIPEEQMDTIVAVNGSSPAYFYLFIKLIADWAEKHGVDKESALDLATASMAGSAEMLRKAGKTPDELIRDVSSPGGTTLAALSSFEINDMRKVMEDALDACEQRSAELSS